MKKTFVTIGGCTQDVYVYVDGGAIFKNLADGHPYLGFKYGGKTLVSSVHHFFGGGGANSAASFASLGMRVRPIMAVGADATGASIVANLAAKGVDTSLIQRYKREKSGYSVITLGVGEEQSILTYRGANGSLKLGVREKQAIRGADWVYVSSQSGDWPKILSGIFSARNGRPLAWNPGGAQLKAGKDALAPYFKKTAVLILNSDEALDLLRPRYGEALGTESLLTHIHALGPRYFLMTEGAAGAHLYDGRKFYFQAALRHKHVIDTVGAGDAFGSGFVAGLELCRGDIKRALRLAAANSAEEIGLLGPQRSLVKKAALKRIA